MTYFAKIHAAQEDARERAVKRAIARAAYKIEHALYLQNKREKEEAYAKHMEQMECERWEDWASEVFGMTEAERDELSQMYADDWLDARNSAWDAIVRDRNGDW